MEPLSAAGDRPAYLQDAKKSKAWLLVVLLAVALAGAGAYYYFYYRATQEPPPSAPPKTAETPAAAPARPEHELKPQAEAALPSLENSDTMMRESIAGLVGQKAFDEFFIPESLVRRIVATVDNLPRATTPRRTMPLHKVPGAFAVAGAGDQLRIAASNTNRYRPYVRVFSSLDAKTVVQRYVRTYPLFQRAYEELGYSGKYFNDRLIEAIDDLLEAPELDAPVRVAPAPVIYKFTDADLEDSSAGQKVMIRMGKANELAVKAKLREIRRELIAAGVR